MATDWYVYLLRCRDGTLYTGIAVDVAARVDTHQNGNGAKYTRSRLPVALVYQERQPDRSSAQKREAALRKLGREAKLALIERAIVLGLFFLLVLTMGSYTRADGERGAATVPALDNAIRLLADSSADYRAVLQDTLAALRADPDGAAGRDIHTFLTRAPAQGADFKCGVDFVRRRARKELLRIRTAALTGSASPVEPEFCYAAPYVVDLSYQSSARRELQIYGYDFDRVSLEVFLVNGEDYHDVTPFLVRRSHYHLSLSLGDGGVELSPKSRSLGLSWGNLIHGSIPVIQPNTSLCTPRIDVVAPAEVPVRAQPWSNGLRPDERPRVRVLASAALDHVSNELDAVACVTAVDRASGRTLASGCDAAFLLTLDPDSVVEAVLGQTSARVSYVHGGRPVEHRTGGGGGLVRGWTFAVGNDVEPRLVVRFNPVRVVSRDNDGCVSPIAYGEARRTQSLSQATTLALDRQWTALPREVRTLRPRFAPPD